MQNPYRCNIIQNMILLKIGIIKLVEFTLWVLLLLIDWKSTIVSTIKDAVAKKGEMLMKKNNFGRYSACIKIMEA